MNKLDMLFISAKTKMLKMKESITSKQFGDSQVVVALILVAVAVGLCIVFRNAATTILEDVREKVLKVVDDLSKGAVNGTSETPSTPK